MPINNALGVEGVRNGEPYVPWGPSCWLAKGDLELLSYSQPSGFLGLSLEFPALPPDWAWRWEE